MLLGLTETVAQSKGGLGVPPNSSKPLTLPEEFSGMQKLVHSSVTLLLGLIKVFDSCQSPPPTPHELTLDAMFIPV